MISLAYPGLDAIVCLNKQEAGYYKKFTETIVIPNFIQSNATINSVKSDLILSVGWLIPRKGIDLMLPVAKQILEQYPGWNQKKIDE